jgi:penicillin-binding protein 1A
LWARFKKQATAGDEPDPFKSPQGLTSANVCRDSGQLPGAFCTRVITEYFTRGNAPIEVCQQHNFYIATSGQLASALPAAAVRESLPPGAQRAPSVADAAASRDRTLAIADPPEEPAKKKRGFWGRLFGRGDDDGDDRKDEKKKAND